jgi:hypothetical protein
LHRHLRLQQLQHLLCVALGPSAPQLIGRHFIEGVIAEDRHTLLGMLRVYVPNELGEVVIQLVPLGLVEIEDALACLGIGELGSDEPVFDEILSDCADWDFGEQDCGYAISMICAWDKESDRPRAGRHQWALNKAVRLAAAHRLGCLTADGLCAALEHLHRCLEVWCSTVGHPRALHHDEVGSAYRWAMRKVATFDDNQTRDQLGDHRHGGAWSTW